MNWVGLLAFIFVLLTLNAAILIRMRIDERAELRSGIRTPRAAWMFKQHPPGTLPAAAQRLNYAHARLLVGLGYRRTARGIAHYMSRTLGRQVRNR